MLILSLGITELVSWGVLVYAFSVFLVPMREGLGWSDAQLSGAYALGVVVSGLAAVPVGRWLDRRGPRALMTAGSVLAVIVVLAWARIGSLPGFYAVFAFAGLAMAATLYEPAFAMAARWFSARRAQAVLVLTIFGGLASVVFLPLSAWLVGSFGWRSALVILAGILGVVCIPIHALVLRSPDRASPARDVEGSSGAGARLAQALRSRSFLWLTASLSIATLGRIAISVHLVSYLAGRGYTLGEAALVTGGIGLLQIAGRAIATVVGTRGNEYRVYTTMFVIQGISLALPLATSGHGAGATAAVVAFVVLYGLGYGLPELIRGVSVADYYSLADYAGINGVLGFFVTLSRAAGPAAAGVAVSLSGSYTPMLAGAGLAALVSAAALVAAERAHARERRGQAHVRTVD